jgi:FkbM family methyltransferase
MSRIVSYAQNREDIVIYRFFPELTNGTYIDVGANHPEHFSVTKLFYDLGWRGVNIEPIERLHALFVQQRPEDVNLNVALGSSVGTLDLREYVDGDGLSTLSHEMKAHYETNATIYTDAYRDTKVPVRTLESIFNDYKLDSVQLLKIDVEGFEHEVLKGNNWSKYRPELVCIEANHITEDWRGILNQAEYSFVFFDGLNEYFLRNESRDLLESFNAKYVTTILARGVIDSDLKDEIETLQNQYALSLQQVEVNNHHLEATLLKERAVFTSRIEHLERLASRPVTWRNSLQRGARVVDQTVSSALSAFAFKAPHTAYKAATKSIKQIIRRCG